MTSKPLDLTAVISEVIENLSMMVVENPREWEDFHPQLEGFIEFTGPVNGRLTLRCGEGVARSLASNLLGTEQDDLQTQTSAWDALAELLNVVCGNLVTVLFDDQKPFQLSPPQINTIPEVQVTDPRASEKGETGSVPDNMVTRLMLDGQPIEFCLVMDQ